MQVPVLVSVPCPENTVKLQIVGSVEWALVGKDGVRAKARIDTGAKTSSIHAEKVQEFERDGKPWVRFEFDGESGATPVKMERPVERRVRIKRHDDSSQRRYVVKLLMRLGELQEQVEVSLNDRTDFDYPVLIGRNFLTDNAVVDVSRQFVIKKGKR